MLVGSKDFSNSSLLYAEGFFSASFISRYFLSLSHLHAVFSRFAKSSH